MDSARGQVQHLNYSATFPLLLNISGRPAYFISLKDAAGLVKMYAFVDVAQYQIVGTGQTIDEAKRNTVRRWDRRKSKIRLPRNRRQAKLSPAVEAIENVVISGNTYYCYSR